MRRSLNHAHGGNKSLNKSILQSTTNKQTNNQSSIKIVDGQRTRLSLEALPNKPSRIVKISAAGMKRLSTPISPPTLEERVKKRRVLRPGRCANGGCTEVNMS